MADDKNQDAGPPAETAPPPNSAPAAAPEAQPPEPSSAGFTQDDFEAEAGVDSGPAVSWTASEFIAHQKTFGWYMTLALATAALTALVYFITRDIVSSGVAVAAGLLLGIYAGRKPRELEYQVDGRGISIGEKFHGYNEFKSFSVSTEGAFASAVFMPLKRFASLMTIYYAPEDEEKIMSVISGHLPFEPHRADAVDRLIKRIRF